MTDKHLTTTQAAKLADMTPASFRSMATRARAEGTELRAPAAVWPDGRTPLWDARAVGRYLAARPGRGWHGPRSGS